MDDLAAQLLKGTLIGLFYGWWAVVSAISLICAVTLPPVIALAIVRLKRNGNQREGRRRTDGTGGPGVRS